PPRASSRSTLSVPCKPRMARRASSSAPGRCFRARPIKPDRSLSSPRLYPTPQHRLKCRPMRIRQPRQGYQPMPRRRWRTSPAWAIAWAAVGTAMPALPVASAGATWAQGAAQGGQGPAPGSSQSPLAGQTSDTKPYDDKLMRLSEILGAVHYLRELCGANDGQKWRDQMRELMDTEGSSALRRAKLTRSFNNGYRAYSRTYGTCS